MVTRILKSAILLVSLWAMAAHAQQMTLSVDKNPIVTGDVLAITLKVDAEVPRSKWQPEQWYPNFDIINTSSNTSLSSVNGVVSRNTELTTYARVGEPGDYTIGPVSLELEGITFTSNAVNLQVVAADQQGEVNANQPAFMRVKLSEESVFVQQQVQLEAKLYLAANLQTGNIIPPQVPDADVRQVGRDQESTEILNGKKYQVFTRTFAITPKRSGTQTITGPVFQGQIARSTSRSMFPLFTTSETVTTAAQDLTLEVKPIPAAWPSNATWFPVELATLTLDVSGADQINDTLQTQQGDPLTLTFRLTAVGVQPEQMPRLDALVEQLDFANANVYPEQPESTATQRDGKIIAQQSLTVAVLPHQAGELTIPALEVPWYNTVVAAITSARTQPLQLKVTPAQGLQPSQPQQTPVKKTTQVGANAIQTADTASGKIYWQMATVVLAALWLMTLVWVWLRPARVAATSDTSEATDHERLSVALKDIKKACMANDAAATEQMLRHWARQDLGLATGDLMAIAAEFNHVPLHKQLEHLQLCRYANKELTWQEGKALWRAIQGAIRHVKAGRGKQAEDLLPRLYP